MRILHILDHSIPLQSGYTFRTLSILQEQRARGWQTDHLTSWKHVLPAPPREQVDGWEFYRTPKGGSALAGLPLLGEIALMHRLAARIDEVAAEVKPDILHAHSPVLNALPALRIGRRRRLPVVYEVRAFWEDAAVSHGTSATGDLRYRLSRRLETHALRRADAVTTICEGLRGDILARGVPAAKVTVIPNAVSQEEFAGPGAPDPALAARLGLTGKIVLGFLGSFYHYEGLHLLLEALATLAESAPAVRLLLVGGGPEEAKLRAQAERLRMGDRVVFTGRVPHSEVQKYYALVDLLVYPRVSIRLTELVTPLKPLEAMAQEKIVLASDVGGHRELIRDNETGYLFPPDDPRRLAARVVEVLARRADWPAMRARGRRFVATERSWRASVARYQDVYDRLVRR
jgi:PEP-CTERM/exosortase A-associated glycosyltransferase